MAEEDLKKVILEKIQQEKRSLLSQAKQEYAKILSEAKREASFLKKEYLSQIEKEALLKKNKELNTVIQELKRKLLAAQEEKISEVFSLVEEKLKEVRKDREHYKVIFRQLFAESLESINKLQALSNSSLKLKVNTADRQLALEVLKEFKVDAQLETIESIEAGLVFSDLAENFIVLNTFASRLEKIMPQLREEVSKILFG